MRFWYSRCCLLVSSLSAEQCSNSSLGKKQQAALWHLTVVQLSTKLYAPAWNLPRFSLNSHRGTPDVPPTPAGLQGHKGSTSSARSETQMLWIQHLSTQKSQNRGRSQPCAQMFNKLLILFHYSSCNAIMVLKPDALHFTVNLNWREIFIFLYRSKSTWEKNSGKSSPYLKLTKLDFVQHLFNGILSCCLIRTTKAQ